MMHPAVTFLVGMFGSGHTSEPVYVCSLANDDAPEGEPRERRILSREMDQIERFIVKWDRPHRGLFFCVGTIPADAPPTTSGGSPRNRDNICEILTLHADIDQKDVEDGVSLDEVQRRIGALPCPPSVENHSGHGIHAYWPLNEALPNDHETRDRVEALLRQLADLVGGDIKVAEISRLMRLPGTHNTKRGGWIEVAPIRADFDVRYELSDIEDMVATLSPIVKRREVVSATGARQTNPFLAIASRLGFKPSVDVSKRLDAMVYGGTGDASIHETQLAVSASLLNRGTALDEVVDILTEATRAAAGEMGTRWNWAREEKAIRRMCEDWVRKHPEKVETVRRDGPPRHKEAVGGGSVVDLSAARQEKAKEREKVKAKPKPDKDEKDKVPPHVVAGTCVVETIRARGEDIIATDGAVWVYSNGLWSLAPLDGRRWIDSEVEVVCRALSIPSTGRVVSEARGWILRHPEIYRRADIAWDQHGKIPTRSGLIDPLTLAIEPARPNHYATWRIECEYDPAATCPWWEVMLNDVFSDRDDLNRAATIGILQEAYGCNLVDNKPRSLIRAIILQGGSEAGKSQVLDVLGGLLSDRPISTPLAALDGAHGTMEFSRRAPWVLHEAFDQSQWLLSSKVKQILSGNPIQINIKNGPVTTEKVKAPVIWGTNHPPQFKESSAAIVNRILVFACRAVFSRTKPRGAAAEAVRAGYGEPAPFILATEMSGLLNWAIAGMRRGLKRGYLATTPELDEALNEVRLGSNMVSGFFEECVEFDPGSMISTSDFCAAFAAWWSETKGEFKGTPSNDSIGKAVAALADPRIGQDKKEMRDMHRRYYAGIRLNDIGGDYWAAAEAQGAASGKNARISAARDEVNRDIPGAWNFRETVARMRRAFEDAKCAEATNDTCREETHAPTHDRPQESSSVMKTPSDTYRF